MFWFKRKEIVVDCFTYDAGVFSKYPPARAHKFIPTEWKSLPKYVEQKAFPESQNSKLMVQSSTLKNCSGFINLFKSGFIIQMHTDLFIEVESDGHYNVSAPAHVQISGHPRSQYWDSLYRGYTQIKIVPKWSISEKTGVNWVMTKPSWHNTEFSDAFHPISGVLSFKDQHSPNVNFFAKPNSVLSFKAGSPLTHLIPMSDAKIKIVTHLMSETEYISRFKTQHVYVDLLSENIRVNEFNKPKCPFGFGK
jgi:hypothetical protein